MANLWCVKRPNGCLVDNETETLANKGVGNVRKGHNKTWLIKTERLKHEQMKIKCNEQQLETERGWENED